MAEIYMRDVDVPDDMRHLFEEVRGGGMTDVFALNPQAFPKSHFATFPEKLVEPCLRNDDRHTPGHCSDLHLRLGFERQFDAK